MTNLALPSRRGFITGLASLVAAPAIVRVASLMPVKVLPSGISMRMITDYCPDDAIITRLDVLYGWSYPRPEWLQCGGQALIDLIPEHYDTRNNDA